MTRTNKSDTALIVGASRGLGLAIAREFLNRGWNVVGTVRGTARTKLHDMAEAYGDRLGIEQLDITEAEEITALRQRLSGRSFNLLLVSAGIANQNQDETMAQLSTEEFDRIMRTNVLGVMRSVEGLQELVPPTGTLAVISSGQGSIANNEKGGNHLYRTSKAALNQAMRSYAAQASNKTRALVLLAPGWIRTDMGGPNAPFSLDETVPDIVNVLLAQQGKPGLRYLDRMGNVVPW